MKIIQDTASAPIDTVCVLPSYSPLYDKIISLCLDLGELDAAVAIVAEMETAGITVPDQTLDRVISARQNVDNVSEQEAA